MSKNPGEVVTDFVAAFASRDATRLAPFLHADVEFQAYGDAPIKGREAVVALWANVLHSMGDVDFSTVHQAVNGEVVLAEQIHGLALPGRPLAPIRNMAAYRVVDDLILQWRDYTNPEYARTLL